jgi:L-amino acid N-acyltransferase YncA
MTKSLRLARIEDSAPILDIYAPYIESTSYTFETEVPTIAEFGRRIESCMQQWPWLVCEMDGSVAGYAYAAKHRERVAYQWSVESSVYVHHSFERHGVAKALYTALIAILKMQEFRNLYAVINLPNDKSVAFHEKIGFEYFATYANVGYKLGKWKNVGWWQLKLNDYTEEPEPPVPFPIVPNKEIKKILGIASELLRT